jgi:DNA-binding MarR family transcriptional regulator
MLLRAAYLSMHRSFEGHFTQLKATADQFVLLTMLAEESGIIQQELARRICSDPNTITAMLSRLEKRGLIERRAHEGDGRARCVHLTAKGRRFQHKLDNSASVLHERLARAIAPDQLEAVLKGLAQIASAMVPVTNRRRKSGRAHKEKKL